MKRCFYLTVLLVICALVFCSCKGKVEDGNDTSASPDVTDTRPVTDQPRTDAAQVESPSCEIFERTISISGSKTSLRTEKYPVVSLPDEMTAGLVNTITDTYLNTLFRQYAPGASSVISDGGEITYSIYDTEYCFYGDGGFISFAFFGTSSIYNGQSKTEDRFVGTLAIDLSKAEVISSSRIFSDFPAFWDGVKNGTLIKDLPESEKQNAVFAIEQYSVSRELYPNVYRDNEAVHAVLEITGRNGQDYYIVSVPVGEAGQFYDADYLK